MATKTLWIIERKYRAQGYNWEPSLDHSPYKRQYDAERRVRDLRELHPEYCYRIAKFDRAEG